MDPAVTAAFGRLTRLWKPMLAWSALVWAVVAGVLTPLSSFFLGWSWLQGSEEVVANEALLSWIISLRGVVWVVLAGSLALTGTVLHFAGIFEITTEDLEGVQPSVPETAFRLVPRMPALLRLSAGTVLAAVILAAPLVAGLAGIHQLFLGARDINYYLAERPPAWWLAVGSAVLWSLVWGIVVAWLVGRSLLALPSYVDGHRPLYDAVRRSWRDTRGEGRRIMQLLAGTVLTWWLLRVLLNTGAAAGGSAVIGRAASASESLDLVLAVTGGWVALTVIVDTAVTFLGIAFVSTLLTKLYYEDTDLHTALEAPRVREISERAKALAFRWLHPTRLLPALGLFLILSAATGVELLERMPEPRPVAIIAHRAGPPPSPENTLAALERTIASGAGWAEIDVQLSRDRIPVVVHDADLMRVAGDPRRISRTDYRDVAGLVQRPDDGTPRSERRIATLEQFLERARGRIGLVLELKYYGWDPDLAAEVASMVRERGREGEVMVMSLDIRAVRQLRDLGAEVPVGYAAAGAVGDPSRLPVDFLALSRRAATPSLVRSAHLRGIDLHVWTVNRASEMAEVIQEGADGLVTDRPRLAVRVQEELAGMTAISRLLLRFGHLLTEDEEEPVDESTQL